MKSWLLRLASVVGALGCLISSYSVQAGTYGYAAIPEGRSVVVFNAENPQSGVLAELKFPVNEYPNKVLVSPDGTKLLVLTRMISDNKTVLSPSYIYLFQRSGFKLLSKTELYYARDMWVNQAWTRLWVKENYYPEISAYQLNGSQLTLLKKELVNLSSIISTDVALSEDSKFMFLANYCQMTPVYPPKDENDEEDEEDPKPIGYKCYESHDQYGTVLYSASIKRYDLSKNDPYAYTLQQIHGKILSVAPGPDNQSVYLSVEDYYTYLPGGSKLEDVLLLYNVATGKVLQKKVLSGNSPDLMLFDPIQEALYLSTYDAPWENNIVWSYTTNPLAQVDGLKLANAIDGYGTAWADSNLAMNTTGDRVYKGSAKSSNISFINASNPKDIFLIGKLALAHACNSIAISPSGVCGNKIVENQEQCDGGFNCKADCSTFGLKTPICGNGLLEGSEECDDDDLISGNGCSATCKLEKGKAVPPPPADPICGNAKLEKDEECDDGNLVNGDGCDTTCALEEPNPQPQPQPEPDPQDPVEAVCGNHVLEQGEACDDGNLKDSDGCSSACEIEIPEDTQDPVCGNKILEAGEECDGSVTCNVQCKKIVPDENEGSGCSLNTEAKATAGFSWIAFTALVVFAMKQRKKIHE